MCQPKIVEELSTSLQESKGKYITDSMRLCTISVIFMVSCLSFWTNTVSATYLTQYEQNTLKEKGVTLKEFSGEYWLFKSNGIPKHPTGVFPNKDNPNTISEQYYEYLIPKNPVRLDHDRNSDSNYECLNMGIVAFASNGVPMFNPYSAEGFNAVAGPCREVFDTCNAHPDTLGRYHYHQFPNCLYSFPEQFSRLYGVALDGFPIYGPYEKDGTLVDASKLDECHGLISNDGRYEYRITFNFPYILGCYRGKPGSQLTAGTRSQTNARSESQSQSKRGSKMYSGMGPGSRPQNGSTSGQKIGGSQSYSGSGLGSGFQNGSKNLFGSGSEQYGGSQNYSGSGLGFGLQEAKEMYSESGSGSEPSVVGQVSSGAWLGSRANTGNQIFSGSGSGSGPQGGSQTGSGSGKGPYRDSQSNYGSGSGYGDQVSGQNDFGTGSGSGSYSGSQSYFGSGSGSGPQGGNQIYSGSGSGIGPYRDSQSYSGSGSGYGNQVSGQNDFGTGSYSGSQSYFGSGSFSGMDSQMYSGSGPGSRPQTNSQSKFGVGLEPLSQSKTQTKSGSRSGFQVSSPRTDMNLGGSGSDVSMDESQELTALLRMLKINGRRYRVRKSLDKYYQSENKDQLLNELRQFLNQLASTKRPDSSCVKDENWMQQEGVCPLKCENPSFGCS